MEDKLNQYIKGIDNETYHGDKEYLSSSQVKQAIDGHGNFRYYMENGGKNESKWKEGNAMDFGSLVHAMLLEPHTVDTDFAFMDTSGRNWRKKEDQIFKARFLEQYEDKIVLSMNDRERAQTCASEAMKHPFLKKLLTLEGDPEMSGYFEDPRFGLKCRFRPDRKIYDLDGNGTAAILDLKTTANMDDFSKKANWDFNYDLSAHMYLLGDAMLTGEANVPFFFGVIESQEPHRVAVYKASERFLDRGQAKYGKAMSNIVKAMKLPRVETAAFQEVDYQEI